MKVKQILQKLSKYELGELHHYLQLGLLGNQPYVYQLFEACIKLNKTQKDWGIDDVVPLIFPEGKPSERKKRDISNRGSKLNSFIRKYLALKSFLQDQPMIDYAFIKAINDRHWDEQFSREFKDSIKRIDQAPLKGFSHYTATLHLKDEELFFFDRRTIEVPKLQFQKPLIALDKAFIIKKLSLACKAIAQDRESIDKKKHTLYFLPEVVEISKGSEFQDEPVIQLYLLLLQIIPEVSDEADIVFRKVKGMFFQLLPYLIKLGRFETEDIFIFLVNYCVRGYIQKRGHLGEELVDLYQRILGKGVIDEGGQILAANFKNIISLYSSVSAYNEAEDVFRHFYGKIRGKSGEATWWFCKGHFDFFLERYELAAEMLHKAQGNLPVNEDIQLEAEIRALWVRTSFMQADYTLVNLQLTGLESFIKNKLNRNSSKSISFRKFYVYQRDLNRAARAKDIKRGEKLIALQARLSQESVRFYAEKWILCQIAHLKNSLSGIP